MFTGFNEFISQLFNLFQWWIVIAPFEACIRVRFGKRITVLGPGIHLRIPGFDRFFVQRTRKRYMNSPTQTVSTLDGKSLTISGGTGYSIDDIGLLYDTLSDSQDVIEVETIALVAQYVSTHNFDDINPLKIQDFVTLNLKLERYGLTGVSFLITDYVCVRTYRLINSNPRDYTYSAQALSTQAERVIGT